MLCFTGVSWVYLLQSVKWNLQEKIKTRKKVPIERTKLGEKHQIGMAGSKVASAYVWHSCYTRSLVTQFKRFKNAKGIKFHWVQFLKVTINHITLPSYLLLLQASRIPLDLCILMYDIYSYQNFAKHVFREIAFNYIFGQCHSSTSPPCHVLHTKWEKMSPRVQNPEAENPG